MTIERAGRRRQYGDGLISLYRKALREKCAVEPRCSVPNNPPDRPVSGIDFPISAGVRLRAAAGAAIVAERSGVPVAAPSALIPPDDVYRGLRRS